MVKLVAREAEVAAAVDALRFGRGVVVAGEAGVGKSAIASAVADATGVGAWVLATSAGRDVPFGALGPLLPGDVGTVHPALVPRAVGERLRASGGARVPVLVVDDAQWLDERSAAAVLSLVTGGHARVLLTVRTGTPVSDAVTALWKDGLVTRLDVRPLDLPGTHRLLFALLAGDVASATAAVLWSHSGGNPLCLTELVRFGLETGRLSVAAGLWWWHGGRAAPPRLRELLERRLDGVTDGARGALQVLALGDGLPYETLLAVADETSVLEAEERGLVVSDERDGVLRVRFAHPLLHSVAAGLLTPARRRVLAQRLREVPEDAVTHVGVVQRAAWEEAAGGAPDVDLLLAAADRTTVSDPDAATRLAERAVRHEPTVRAALVLSAAHSEAGRPEQARAAWQVARDRQLGDAERLAVGLEDLSLALWAERVPGRAEDVLRGLRADLGGRLADDVDSTEAVLAVFTARPSLALRLATEVLSRSPAPSPRVRALTALMAARTLVGPATGCAATAEALTHALAATPVAATRSGLAHAFMAAARLLHGEHGAVPSMGGASGRWPAAGQGEPPVCVPAGDEPDGSRPAWPLLAGVRHHLVGDRARALPALREAYLQQQRGEGLFRSEAAAELVVVLVEEGLVEEARDVLDRTPPDAVATVPGLLGWARAAVAAGEGRRADAGLLARLAARQALDEGALATAVRYLADAARLGTRADAVSAAALLPEGPLPAASQVRADGIRARASREARALVLAAEAHLAAGMLAEAGELAALATQTGDDARTARVARAVRVRLAPAGGRAGGASGLTPREEEVARLAVAGRTDREIAETLVLSVRTVETHLRSAYRKLDIDSRRALGPALHPAAPALPRAAPPDERRARTRTGDASLATAGRR